MKKLPDTKTLCIVLSLRKHRFISPHIFPNRRCRHIIQTVAVDGGLTLQTNFSDFEYAAKERTTRRD